MTTYNGMDYLEELLDSIRTQTRIPDEVVIVDDCSTDGTPDFVIDYIERYGLSGWKIYKNEENLGWRKNFRLALRKCSNDLVFLCDQDDIWKQTKIKDMSDIMEKNPYIELLVSDYKRQTWIAMRMWIFIIVFVKIQILSHTKLLSMVH